MPALRALRIALLWLALAVIAVPPWTRAQVYEGRTLVKAELLAKTTAIVPGQPFTVGVLLKMVPHWHTYWKFSGDAGIPTVIKWKLPPGWKVGEIQWPIPLRLIDPGDIQTYGYQDEVLLMQEITPPASVADKAVKLSAQVDWLVCEKICIPGGTTVDLDLSVNASATATNEEIFARYERTAPRPWPAAEIASTEWSRSPAELTLRVKSSALARYPSVEFFPVPDDKVVVAHPATERTADGVIFRLPIDTADAKLSSIPGVIAFGQTADGADRNAWELASPSTPATGSATVAHSPASGLGRFLLLGFLGGFILNLMPCVLPVISLKIFGFIQQAGKSRGKIFRSGLAFSAGIFAWFIGLAFVIIGLKAAGHEVAWALQFTNPYFVVGMSALVLVFALNLFSVFEITLPGGVSTGILAWAAREGDAGSFLHGVFATVLATPCTAPFLGAALGFAFTQSAAIILLMFFAIAAGMSAPYLALSAHPAWLRLLPKPGAWMLHVKHFMGFLMIATLLFLLAVLGAQRGTDAIIWTSCFLLALSIACWMWGAFLTPVASASSRVVAIVLMLALVLGSGAYFIRGKFAQTKLQANAPLENGWRPFTPQTLEAELARGRPVFIDFTAAWCITCKFNEATVLESSAVRAAFEERGVVKLKADWTNADPAITKILQQFGRPGVPLYVLYPKGRTVEPIILPELLTKNIVLEKLETIVPRVAAQ